MYFSRPAKMTTTTTTTTTTVTADGRSSSGRIATAAVLWVLVALFTQGHVVSGQDQSQFGQSPLPQSHSPLTPQQQQSLTQFSPPQQQIPLQTSPSQTPLQALESTIQNQLQQQPSTIQHQQQQQPSTIQNQQQQQQPSTIQHQQQQQPSTIQNQQQQQPSTIQHQQQQQPSTTQHQQQQQPSTIQHQQQQQPPQSQFQQSPSQSPIQPPPQNPPFQQHITSPNQQQMPSQHESQQFQMPKERPVLMEPLNMALKPPQLAVDLSFDKLGMNADNHKHHPHQLPQMQNGVMAAQPADTPQFTATGGQPQGPIYQQPPYEVIPGIQTFNKPSMQNDGQWAAPLQMLHPKPKRQPTLNNGPPMDLHMFGEPLNPSWGNGNSFPPPKHSKHNLGDVNWMQQVPSQQKFASPVNSAMAMFNPMSYAQQPLDMASNAVEKVRDYGVEVKNDVGTAAVNMGYKLVDGSQAVVKSMVDAASVIPDTVFDLKRKSLDVLSSLLNLPPRAGRPEGAAHAYNPNSNYNNPNYGYQNAPMGVGNRPQTGMGYQPQRSADLQPQMGAGYSGQVNGAYPAQQNYQQWGNSGQRQDQFPVNQQNLQQLQQQQLQQQQQQLQQQQRPGDNRNANNLLSGSNPVSPPQPINHYKSYGRDPSQL